MYDSDGNDVDIRQLPLREEGFFRLEYEAGLVYLYHGHRIVPHGCWYLWLCALHYSFV